MIWAKERREIYTESKEGLKGRKMSEQERGSAAKKNREEEGGNC